MKQLDTPAGCFASKSKILHVVIETGSEWKGRRIGAQAIAVSA